MFKRTQTIHHKSTKEPFSQHKPVVQPCFELIAINPESIPQPCQNHHVFSYISLPSVGGRLGTPRLLLVSSWWYRTQTWHPNPPGVHPRFSIHLWDRCQGVFRCEAVQYWMRASQRFCWLTSRVRGGCLCGCNKSDTKMWCAQQFLKNMYYSIRCVHIIM